ncbi:hypothetical protein BOTBODRAFT_329967 [Botryobasidium botryosum FD-172 SS1]|uniref:Uncharacterized protein n=1 Tax=Botryobasidium botryosum (strain FD-172 SS1) TaxID=930990 RepID=A0A067MTD9_BOTB1|nr:hypothetical protein BOTBODRAFT_329967 [Botryobasidium botryosum FD-172 SS1]
MATRVLGHLRWWLRFHDLESLMLQGFSDPARIPVDLGSLPYPCINHVSLPNCCARVSHALKNTAIYPCLEFLALHGCPVTGKDLLEIVRRRAACGRHLYALTTAPLSSEDPTPLSAILPFVTRLIIVEGEEGPEELELVEEEEHEEGKDAGDAGDKSEAGGNEEDEEEEDNSGGFEAIFHADLEQLPQDERTRTRSVWQ